MAAKIPCFNHLKNMHHSVSLTTNFVKSFFPNNSLTNNTSSASQPELPSTPEVTLPSPNNTFEQQAAPETPAVSSSTIESNEPKKVVEEASTSSASIDEVKLIKFKYDQLKVRFQKSSVHNLPL